MKIHEPIVLIVDDSNLDGVLMKVAFARAGFLHAPRFAANGADAIAYLQGDGCYSDRMEFPMPTVILMDLNMPGLNGLETLTWILTQALFKRIHIYVLSASDRPEDIEEAYDLGANSFLLKPGNLDGLIKMVRVLAAWIDLSHFASSPKNKKREAKLTG